MTLPSILDDDVFTALVSFVNTILSQLGAQNVQQGQQNRTPMPLGPDWCLLVPADRSPLATTVHNYTQTSPHDGTGTRQTARSTQVGVFVNFYGPNATDNGQVFNQLFRDMYGYDFLIPSGVAPLWCDDGRQMPLIDSEEQYQTRWMIHALVEIVPVVSTAQQFADSVKVTTFYEADNGS